MIQFFLERLSSQMTDIICAAPDYFLHIRVTHCAEIPHLVHKADLRRGLCAGIDRFLHIRVTHCVELPHLVHKAHL